jgi:hypothetical protein
LLLLLLISLENIRTVGCGTTNEVRCLPNFTSINVLVKIHLRVLLLN